MKKNDTLVKYNTKNNKLERLFILAINNYYEVAICPEFTEDDRFIQYVYMDNPLVNTNSEEQEYAPFNINKLPKNYVEDVDKYINKDMFNKLLETFNKGLAEAYGERKDVKETLDFIYVNTDKIFTKQQLKDFFDLINYPTVNRLDIFESLDFGKVRAVTFGAWEKFKKDIIDRQG